MLLGFILIILIIWIWISLAVYSMFLPFLQDIWEVRFYNSAYYGAIAWVERWLLAVRYHKPWFEWSGWFFGDNNFGPNSDMITGNNMWNMSDWENGISWNIKSRSSNIPSIWQWNINNLFSSWSENYNQLDYYSSENFFLYIDDTTSNSGSIAYSPTLDSNVSKFAWNQINISLRTNPNIQKYIKDIAWNNDAPKLDINSDLDWDWLLDDSLVYRYWKWDYLDWLQKKEFLIMPIDDTKYYSGSIKWQYDSMVRESVINWLWQWPCINSNLNFASTTNPACDLAWYTQPLRQNVISEVANTISWDHFTQILSNNNYSNLEFGISLTNFLHSQHGQIYPFLEYKIDTDGNVIADRFFDISGVWYIYGYKIQINLKKPTNKEFIWSDFTIIF